MYIQNINSIKAVAIMLDGCILDLNKYRYNYYKNLCEQNHTAITKQEFYDNLASQYTMYNDLPLCDKYKSSQINQKIEDEMYTYLKFKGTYTKEGLFELLDYFKQKDIMIAVLSTHRTKKAVEYLQMTRVFSHVHFIIGSDTKYKPLPSSETLKAITNQFEITPKELLVISPFLSLNMTANDFGSSVIYYKDLIEPTALERASSIKTVNNFFEILNFLLLEKAYDSNIYSSMLGMSDKMNKEELDQVNNHLKKIYRDDEQILNIVQDTYEYHLSQLNEDYPKEEKHEIIIEENDEEIIDEKKEDIIDDSIQEKEIPIEDTMNKNILSINKEQELELTSAWNQLLAKEEKHIEEKEDIEEIEKEESSVSFIDYIIYIFSEFFYSLTISFIILAAGITIVLLGRDLFISTSFIMSIFNGYLSIVEFVISSLFNGIHSIINVLPDYYTFAYNSNFLSPDGVLLFNILLFNGLVIFMIKMIILAVKRDKIFFKDDE